jgi:hypothetical protein
VRSEQVLVYMAMIEASCNRGVPCLKKGQTRRGDIRQFDLAAFAALPMRR